MKRTPATALVLLIPWLSTAQEAPKKSAEEALPKATAPGSSESLSVPVPVVRVPGGAATSATEVSGAAQGVAERAETVIPAPEPSADGAGVQLGWSSSAMGLREPTVTTLRTNRSFEVKGALPRVTRPERKGFGGFISGFANLFNPFAPTSKGVESRGEHWYDGGVQRNPLPRGFRDERMHEPQSAIFSTEFGGASPDEAPQAPPAKPAAPVKR